MTTLAALGRRWRGRRLPKAGLATLAHFETSRRSVSLSLRTEPGSSGRANVPPSCNCFWAFRMFKSSFRKRASGPYRSPCTHVRGSGSRCIDPFGKHDPSSRGATDSHLGIDFFSEFPFLRFAARKPTQLRRCVVKWEQVAPWADTALTREINAVRRKGKMAWLLGSDLPVLAKAERFWGNKLLVPLGYRPEPAWPESVLVDVAGIEKGELLVLRPDRVETLPLDAFQHLTRAAIHSQCWNDLP